MFDLVQKHIFHKQSLKDLTTLPLHARECKELTLLLVRDCQDRAASLANYCSKRAPTKQNVNWNVDDRGRFPETLISQGVWQEVDCFLQLLDVRWVVMGCAMVLSIDRRYVLTVKSKNCWFLCGTDCNILLVASYIKSHQNTKSWSGTFKITRWPTSAQCCKDACIST